MAQGASRDFNPTLSEGVVQRALERDHAAGSAEYLAQFRVDIESFIAREVVETAVAPGRYELPPNNGANYVAFCDPSGGSNDSFTLAIAHGDKDGRGILDVIREQRPPFSPDAVVQEFTALLKRYGIMKVQGDRYGGDWPAERFRAHGMTYEQSERPKSQIYGELLPLLNSGRVELLDHARLVAQLCDLERHTSRGGKDSIDHTPGGHDDIANAVAGALLLAQDGRSLLWRRDALLVEPLPHRPDLIYAVLVIAAKTCQAGVAYFATSGFSRPGSPICLLDCELGPLSPSLLHGIFTRLTEFADACSARCGGLLFTTSSLADELERMGYQSQIIDRVVDDAMLAISAAIHVSAQRVRMCALTKSFPLTFLQGLAAVQDDDDPLRVAFLAGVAVALDTNRSIGRAPA